MATSTTDKMAVGGSEAVEYWSHYFRTAMTPLFESVGGYSAEEIEQHLAFIDEHVAPVIGPVPSEPYGRFDKAFCPCPMEVSVNLTTNGKPNVRYWINHGKPLDPSYLEAGNALRQADALRRVAKATGADTRWMECLLGIMLPSPEQLDGIRARQAASKGPVWPFCQFGFDFRGSDKIMRSYFPCIPKAGMTRTEVCIDAVNCLEPLGGGLKSAMDLCTAYLLSDSGKKYEIGFHIVAVENLDPEEGRVKIYVDVNNNSWNAVRDVMTLGGRLNDEVTLKGLEILKSIYHLIRDEPEDRPDDYSKPSPPDMPFPGIQFGFDLTAGNPIPSIKIYGHMRRLSNFDSKKAACNQVNILQKLGHPWGFNGQLEAVMKSVNGDDMVRGVGAISYAYSRKKGAYTSFYLFPYADYKDKVEGLKYRDLSKA